MRIGVGLPNTIPGTPGPRLAEWASHAEELGFSTLATIGRLVFPTYDEIQALTVAAVVTDRIELFTNVMIAPAYDRALLAKQAAGLDQISEGRFTLGMGSGWRDEDFTVNGKEYSTRGRRFDADIEFMQRAWRGEIVDGATKRLTPVPMNGDSVPVALGGNSAAAFRRAARFGIGWSAGGASPDEVSGLFDSAREAWTTAGRVDSPKLWALTYFTLGEGGRETATEYLSDYYGDWGPNMAQRIPADAEGLGGAVAAFEDSGADELIFVPVSSGLEQLDQLAEALRDHLTAQRGTLKAA